MKLVGLIFAEKFCGDPACGHADGWLQCIGFPLGEHWVDITKDGKLFNVRVDETVKRVGLRDEEIRPFLAAALQEVDDVR
jgi:hypothetical protein